MKRQRSVKSIKVISNLDNANELFDILASLKKRDEAKLFIHDLCTPKEIQSLVDRWKVARLISEGMSYREIAQLTGVSTATITRVGRAIQSGSGYRRALAKNSGRGVK
ncbi:MAG: helix-turn-helix domain-containing protein [Bdellovibrionales bacterium]|nr:helix-turn-helix domain-containing protein [Bdellovibrionales bacterium]